MPGPGTTRGGGSASTKYERTLTIGAAAVASDITNFPTAFCATDATLKTVANAGHVFQSNGNDILVYASDGTTLVPFKLEKYDGTTGELCIKFKAASITAAGGATFKLRYGDTAATTDQTNTTGIYTSEYVLAADWSSQGGSLSLKNDITGSNGTNTSGTTTTGKIDGGLNLGGSAYVTFGTSSTLSTAITSFATWINITSFSTCTFDSYCTVSSNINSDFNQFLVNTSGKLALFISYSAGGYYSMAGTGTATLSTGTWYHIGYAADGNGTTKTFVNGVQDHTDSVGGTYKSAIGGNFTIGEDLAHTGRTPNAKFDASHQTNDLKAVVWFKALYDNGSATWPTMGSESNIP
jgi:hypothetical protein